MKNIIFALNILSCLAPASAQNERDSIDCRLDNCLKSNNSPDAQTQCLSIAREEWDNELVRVYQLLVQELKPDGQVTLKTAQEHWLEYRDAERANIDAIYRMKQGSMFSPMQANECMELVRKRTNELREYVFLLKEM